MDEIEVTGQLKVSDALPSQKRPSVPLYNRLGGRPELIQTWWGDTKTPTPPEDRTATNEGISQFQQHK